MFVPIWLFFLASGTLMALLTLIWAMRTEQFEDQDRARFLPLVGLAAEEVAPISASGRRAAKLATLALLLSGAFVLLTTLLVVLRHN